VLLRALRLQIFDSSTLECLKTFQPERPVNAATLSPIFDHAIVGGGQDAMSVTMTSNKAGKFESKIYQKVFGEEIGGIKGHFGPINALAISPDGRSFASGGEDGFVRIHHFDADYFRLKL
jgi:translation initiation factor 3 subunit I